MSETEERMESGGSDGEEEAYEVEKICNHKKNRSGVFLYWIKWKGYAEEENTWEEEANLAGAEELLKEYKDAHMPKKTPAAATAGKKKKSGYKSDDSGDESFSLDKIKSEPKAKRGRKSGAKSREVVGSDDDDDSDGEQMSGRAAQEDHSLLPASEDCLRMDRACRPKKLPPDVPEGTLYFIAVFNKDRKLLIPQDDALKFYPQQLATFLLKKTAFSFPEAATALNGNGNHDSD